MFLGLKSDAELIQRYRDVFEKQSQIKNCYMYTTTAQLVQCFQVVYQKKYQEQLMIAESLPKAQRKERLATLQTSQVLADLKDAHIDITFRPYKIFNKFGKIYIIQEDQDCTIMGVDYQLEFLPAKGDRLFPLF